MAAAQTYKKSRGGDAKIGPSPILCGHSGMTPTILEFFPYGYDEREFCSPGFNLPVGLFQRSRFAEIPQYHTSADNLDFIRPDHLARSYRLLAETLDVIENDAVYRNKMPKLRTTAWKVWTLWRDRGRQGSCCRQYGHAMGTQSF